MQAIILAGGYWTRLYPLTINAPKPMIRVNGKPMIEYLVEKLNNIPEISQIFVVSNAKFSQVFTEWVEKKNYTNITVVNDWTESNETRLGPIGDLNFLMREHSIDEDVLILWWDNLFEDDLSGIIDIFHKNGVDVIGLYDVGSLDLARELWNVTLDENNTVTSFVEKPENPSSSLCATMIYALKKEHLKYIPILLDEGKKKNAGEIKAGELIAYVMKSVQVYGQILQWKWFDIGTLEQLKKAEDWIHLKNDKK